LIDKNSVIPIYIQLQQIIKNRIISGEYKDGEIIPSETQLADQYDITRTTVRKAITNLVGEGLLKKVHGKGTYVNLTTAKYNIWNFGGFTNYLKKNGKIVVSKVIEAGIVDLEQKKFFKLVRARGTQEGIGIVYLTIDTSLIPLDRFEGIEKLDFSKLSLYDTMRNIYGIIPKIAEIEVKPTIKEPLAYEYFEYDEEEPLLMVSGKIYTSNHEEIERVNVVYSPDINFKMAVEME
jgi:DNA-binding GntR family transcriptional regulator